MDSPRSLTGMRRRFQPKWLESRSGLALAQGFTGWEPPETTRAVPVDGLTVHAGA